jgi:hypothetical protein
MSEPAPSRDCIHIEVTVLAALKEGEIVPVRTPDGTFTRQLLAIEASDERAFHASIDDASMPLFEWGTFKPYFKLQDIAGVGYHSKKRADAFLALSNIAANTVQLPHTGEAQHIYLATAIEMKEHYVIDIPQKKIQLKLYNSMCLKPKPSREPESPQHAYEQDDLEADYLFGVYLAVVDSGTPEDSKIMYENYVEACLSLKYTKDYIQKRIELLQDRESEGPPVFRMDGVKIPGINSISSFPLEPKRIVVTYPVIRTGGAARRSTSKRKYKRTSTLRSRSRNKRTRRTNRH